MSKLVGLTECRPFKITTSLSEGSGRRGKTHSFDEAARVIEEWIAAQGWNGDGYLPGALQTGTYVLGHGSGEATSTDLEPAIEFFGNVSSFLADMPDDEIKKMLNDLAFRLAQRLGQVRVEVEYC